jgi:hypothetical protein
MNKLRATNIAGRRAVFFAVLALCAAWSFDLGAEADDTAYDRPGFSLITRDGSGDAGEYTSIAIGADGLGLISYYDATNRDLKVAHCSNQSCTSATISSLDRTGDVGQYTSIAIGSDDLGLISYYDATNGDLKVAHCTNIPCTAATLTTVDRTGNVGQYSSLAIGTDKLPLITYYDVTKGDLKAAHCADVACKVATITTLTFLQAEGDVGQYTSVTIAGGQGLISYYDATDHYLKSALCPDLPCTEPTLTTTPDKTGDVGQFSSVAIGNDERQRRTVHVRDNRFRRIAHHQLL